MTLFVEAAHLNNEASDDYLNGKKDMANRKFKSALKMIKAGLSSQTRHDDKAGVGDEQPRQGIRIEPIALSSCQTKHHQENSFMYDQLMTVVFCDNGIHDMHLLAASVIFNIALLSNLECTTTAMMTTMTTTTTNDNDLDTKQIQSLELYRLCVRLFESADQTQRECILIRAACYNNMAKLFFDRSEYDTSREMLQNLQGCICFGNVLQRSDIFHMDEIQGFLLNVMLLDHPTTARAA